MYNPQIHYRALFSIKNAPASNLDNVFQAVAAHMAKWAQNHQQLIPLRKLIYKPWFFQGGKISLSDGSSWVEVRTEKYDSKTKSPEYWVMRFEHTDNDFKMRKWRTDISIHCTDDQNADFYVTVTWFLRKDYFGETPVIPPSSVPRFVSNILTDEYIYCSIGNKRIDSAASYLEAGDGRRLYQFINSDRRIVPVILLNLHTQRCVVNPDKLQKLVLGSAIVYWYDNPSVHEELLYEWAQNSDRYQCGPDAIRVYLPELNFRIGSDFKRHRYFNLSQYAESSYLLINMISQSVFRISSRNLRENVVTNFETLYIHQQKLRLVQLREAANHIPRSQEELEYITALEDENVAVASENRALEEQLNLEEENVSLLEMQLDEARQQITTLENQFGEFGILEGHYKQMLESQIDAGNLLSSLPENLEDVLRLASKLFPHKLIVLDAAFASATIAKFQYVAEAYSLIFSMSTVLHDLLFSGDTGDIEGKFRQSGFNLTMKESSMTNGDKRLMDLRKRTYEGREYFFTAHTKIDKGGKSLRVHFITDTIKKLVVIGHCGDHLETAGTSRRKEA